MDRRYVGVCIAGVLALSSACGGSKTESTAAKPATSSMAVAKGDFGVPECDEYMTKYLACIDSKVPEAARSSMRQGFEQSKAAWKQAATTAQGREALATTCKQALETTKTAMQTYGCSW